MKKAVIGIIAIMLIFMSGCNNNDVLRVGTSLSYPPYEYEEGGQIVGVDIDIMNEIAARMGKRVIVENMEFNDLFSALTYNKIDVIAAGLSVTEKRKETIDFTVPYASGGQKILVNDKSNIESIDDLIDVFVGVEKGTTGDDFAKETFNMTNIRDYDDATKMINALKSNIVSAVIVDAEPAKAFTKKYQNLRIIDINSTHEEYALGLAKNSPYYDEVNNILQEMINDGTVDEIMKRYL